MCYNIKLDLKQRTYDIIEAQQNDDIIVEFEIFDNGIIVDLNEKAVLIKMSTPSKRYIIQSDNLTISENKILAKLNKNISKELGTGILNITILTLDSIQDSTFNIPIIIHECAISENSLVEDDVVTLLEDLDRKIAEATIIKTKIEQAIESGELSKFVTNSKLTTEISSLNSDLTGKISETNSNLLSEINRVESKSDEENKSIKNNIEVQISTVKNTALKDTNGWKKDQATGIIEQWGYVENVTGNWSIVKLPIAMGYDIRNIVVTPVWLDGSPGYLTPTVQKNDNSSFKISASNSIHGNKGACYWRVIGH